MTGLKSLVLFLSALIISVAAFAQTEKQTTRLEQIWAAYFNQTRFSDRWGLWFDAHLRTREDFVTDFSQAIARVGLTYYINDNAKLTLGYAYVHAFSTDAQPDQPEHRPWQQIQWHTKYSKLRLMQYLRLEERFRKEISSPDQLGDGYDFNYRVRYNILASYPIGKKGYAPGGFSAVLNDEVHVNFGKEIVYNYFDQNRFFAGFNYQVNATGTLQAGYLNVFQQLAAGNKYRNINAVRVSYFHNLDLRPKKTATSEIEGKKI